MGNAGDGIKSVIHLWEQYFQYSSFIFVNFIYLFLYNLLTALKNGQRKKKEGKFTFSNTLINQPLQKL